MGADTPRDEMGGDGDDTPRGKRLTLSDIADRLGVSTATVSLALRDSPLVASTTRDKIKEMARQVGYIYNRSAASLRTAKTQIVGVAVHDIINPYFAEIFRSLEDVLEAQGQMVFICNHRDNVERQRAFVDALMQHRADGLILCSSVGTTADEINRLTDQGIPVTLMCRDVEGARAPAVRGDDELGGEMITRHLIAQGHRHIAMAGGRRGSSTGRDRNAGWRKALAEAGIDPDTQIDIPELMTQADGREAAPRILSTGERPTAVMCFNDLVALGMMPALRRAGVEPGPDIAVTGYDDVDGAASRTPSLTTIASHPDEIGRRAADLILRQIGGERVPNTLHLIPPDLKIRDSSPPPGVRLGSKL
ncbi:LacI family DNA-binding transcriptional regulator [Pannonibacter phragmitetus]|uniref:LacI family DNA-binding transcriptional regulator n=1 Tax=Pannonibacter phragmitetus TaxID=121719 RepID=UPI000B9748C2|nr:LacI family DNA-binding transcriptional regulator [Pannonibacter phragmitetus]